MIEIVTALLAPVWPWLLAALAGIAALLGYGARQKARGRHEEKQEATEADHDHAEDIRRRVERDLPDRVREYDGAGWRD